MSLPDDLVSEFVKSTKDVKRTKNETTVYGTIKESNGKLYVSIDGSSTLTPIVSTTSIKDGERVTVMIKNHTATVTGNLTSPSAKQKYVQNIDEKVKEVAAKVEGVISPDDFKILTDKINDMEIDLGDVNTSIEDLKKSKLDVSLSNIDDTTLSLLFNKSGLIKNALITDGVISGQLTGITLGGFKIKDEGLYSGTKSNATNNSLGVFLGSDGQFCIGDANNHIRYYKDASANFNIDICAEQYNFSNGQTGAIKALPNGGYEFNLTKDGTKIVFDIDGKIYRVAIDGTKTLIAG